MKQNAAPQNLAYVMGGTPGAQGLAAVSAGLAPRAEYNLFLRRHPATLVTFADAEQSVRPLVRGFQKRGLAHWAVSAVALAGGWDAYITTGEDVGVPLALLAGLRASRRPIYIITHGSFFASERFRRAMMLVRRLSNVHFLCLSESLCRRLVEEFGVPGARVHNTSYATDTEFFRPSDSLPSAPLSSAAPVIASVGAAHRDYRTLIHAAEGLDVTVKIGADSAWLPLAVDIEGEALPSNVDVRKYAYPVLKQLYAESLFVVIPLYDGRHACGYSAIAEAMAMGKAVVATKTANPSDFIVEGETGLYVRPGDVGDLRAKITYLLENRAQAVRMGRQARERMQRDYSVEAYCGKIEKSVGLGNVS